MTVRPQGNVKCLKVVTGAHEGLKKGQKSGRGQKNTSYLGFLVCFFAILSLH